MNEEYKEFGEEWEKEVLKLNKTQLMNMLRQAWMKSNQLELLVMQLAAFAHFLCQYHTDAKQTRNKIALATTLDEAKEAAMFDYPVVQGVLYNLDIYKIGGTELKLDKNIDTQKAIEYLLSLSSQSA